MIQTKRINFINSNCIQVDTNKTIKCFKLKANKYNIFFSTVLSILFYFYYFFVLFYFFFFKLFYFVCIIVFCLKKEKKLCCLKSYRNYLLFSLKLHLFLYINVIKIKFSRIIETANFVICFYNTWLILKLLKDICFFYNHHLNK